MDGRVFFIDNDKALCEVVAAGLTDAGVGVITATSHGQALAALEQWSGPPPALAVIDIRLHQDELGDELVQPSGLDVAEALQARWRQCPIVMMTGEDNLVNKNHNRELRITALRYKPITAGWIAGSLGRLGPTRSWGEWYDDSCRHGDDDPDSTWEREGWERQLAPLAEQTVRETARKLEAPWAGLFAIDEDTNRVRAIAAVGFAPGAVERSTAALIHSPLSNIACRGEVVAETVAEASPDRHKHLLELIGYRRLLGVPVRLPGHEKYALVFFFGEAGAPAAGKQTARLAAAELIVKADHLWLAREQAADRKAALQGRLLAAFAHDARTPVSSILGGCEKLRDLADDEALRQAAPQTAASLAALAGLLSGAASHLQEINERWLGMLHHAPRQVLEVGPIVQSCLQAVSRSQRKGLMPIRFSLEPAEEKLLVRATTGELMELLLNLLDNAVHHSLPIATAAGSPGTHSQIVVSTALEEGEQGSAPVVAIYIRNTGPGISARDFERIFDPGYSTREAGFGMGLTICRNISRDLGGDISVQDSVRYGWTTFRLWLPSAAAGAAGDQGGP